MKKVFKSLIAAILIVMTMSSIAFAQVGLDITVNGAEITINGTSDHPSKNVMIQTWSGNKKYYIDAAQTDSAGNFSFEFNTEEGLNYQGKVNVGGELRDFSFSTKSSEEIAVQSVELDEDTLELEVGDSETLTATILPQNATNKKLVWKSSNTAIATVDQNGNVTAIKEGATQIEVASEADGSKKDTCDVTVTKGGGGPGPTPTPEEVSVYIRVEGYDETFVPRKRVKVSLFDLTEYLSKASGSSAQPSPGWGVDKFDGPTNAHAIVTALKGINFKKDKDYRLEDYGYALYISMIGGDREIERGTMSGWMYSVNERLPNVGCQEKLLKEGDEILWFYGAFGFETWVTELTADKKEVKAGEEVSVELEGTSADINTNKHTTAKIADATILVNGKEYKVDGKVVKTDKDGNAAIKFDKAGSYTLSAVRYGENNKGSQKDIVRPIPVTIKVTSETSGPPPTSGNGSTPQPSNPVVDEAKNRIDEVYIGESELQVTRQDGKKVAAVDSNLISTKIDEINKIIKEIEEENPGTTLGDDVKVVNIRLSEDADLNTALQLQSDVIEKLKAAGFGINIVFNDTEFRLPPAAIGTITSDEIVEIRKDNVAADVLQDVNEAVPAGTRLLSSVYSMSLYKVSKDGKNEERMDLKGTTVSMKVNPSDMQNISANSLKVNYYDRVAKKWIALDARYDAGKNMVVAEVQ
ncbi:kappa-carrageenase precursor [Oxobacter pfennigii]|uniref:Kappa-carrageenase n=1 Tax=Oxobacter pfennigii TaxID=36849 RepID=A0A0P8Y994_9CLOT|nr:Ig-like domain-containing protein [Oxobacter pfennigii]KPU43362.1 kappa-carrageenase precursor [Oxobacter pfennigii]